MNRYIWVWALLAPALLSSCGPGRKLVSGERDNENSAEVLLKRVIENQMKAEWLDAKANLSMSDGSQSITVSASIKMRKDSVIWMSVKKLGFEVARALVTRDSFFLIDRFNNEYSAEPLSYVEKNFGVPASLSMLELLLLGNPFFVATDSMQVQPAPDAQYALFAEQAGRSNRLWFSQATHRLQRMQVEEREAGRRIDIQLLNYGATNVKQDFSYLRQLELNSRETGRANVQIEFTKVEINVPTDIKFEVPERYKRNQ